MGTLLGYRTHGKLYRVLVVDLERRGFERKVKP
jgi:hypothetical protein